MSEQVTSHNYVSHAYPIVITLFKNYYDILFAIKSNPNASYSQLRKTTKISGGALYGRLRDAKTMKLYTNSDGKHLTELGERWIQECHSNGKPTEKTLKEACLNLPYFKTFYAQHGDLTSPIQIFATFKEYPRDYAIEDKFMAMGVRRYLEGVHAIKLGKRSRIRPKRDKQQKPLLPPQNEAAESRFTMDDYFLLDRSITERAEKFGKKNVIAFGENKFTNP